MIDDDGKAIKRTRDVLSLYTVYDSPTDYPGEIVIRRFETHPNEARPMEAYIFSSLDSARNAMELLGLTRLVRSLGDQPNIVETWL